MGGAINQYLRNQDAYRFYNLLLFDCVRFIPKFKVQYYTRKMQVFLVNDHFFELF